MSGIELLTADQGAEMSPGIVNGADAGTTFEQGKERLGISAEGFHGEGLHGGIEALFEPVGPIFGFEWRGGGGVGLERLAEVEEDFGEALLPEGVFDGERHELDSGQPGLEEGRDMSEA